MEVHRVPEELLRSVQETTAALRTLDLTGSPIGEVMRVYNAYNTATTALRMYVATSMQIRSNASGVA